MEKSGVQLRQEREANQKMEEEKRLKKKTK